MPSEEITSKVPPRKPRMAESVIQVDVNLKSCQLVSNELVGPHCGVQRCLIPGTGNAIAC